MELLVAIDAIDELVGAERSGWRYQEKARVDRLERMCADGTVRGGRVKVNLEAMGDALDEARQLAVADIRRQQGL